jgi:[ribosomal protein S5]-alanine N-acetyltransferase
MYTLETERFILRPFCLDDVAFLDYLHSDIDVMQYTLGRTRNHEENINYAKTMIDLHDQKLGHLVVIRKSDNQPIGRCGFSNFYGVEIDGMNWFYWGSPEAVTKKGDIFKRLELGYTFAKDYWRMGYASEAAIACKNHGFIVEHYGRFSSLIIKENIGSIGVAKKMGAKFASECRTHDRVAVDYVSINEMINNG